MRFRASLFCYAFSSLVTGSPIDRFARKQNSQRILNESKPQPVDASRRLDHHSSAHFDAALNSVGLLLTSAGAQEVVHVWLPLVTRVETRDSPILPLHPMSARITTLIHSSPELATPERLNDIECTMHLHVNDTRPAESRWEARFGRRKKPKKEVLESVTFGRRDGLVSLTDAESRYWLRGAEVEAFECR